MADAPHPRDSAPHDVPAAREFPSAREAAVASDVPARRTGWIACVGAGLAAVRSERRLVLLVWGMFLALAWIAALPAWRWWDRALRFAPEGDRLLDGLNLPLLQELSQSHGASVAAIALGSAWTFFLLALVVNPFIAGGVLGTLHARLIQSRLSPARSLQSRLASARRGERDGAEPVSVERDGTTQNGVAQDDTAPDDMAPDHMAPDHMAQDSTAPDRPARDIVASQGAAHEGAAYQGTAHDGTAHDGAAQERVEQARAQPLSPAFSGVPVSPASSGVTRAFVGDGVRFYWRFARVLLIVGAFGLTFTMLITAGLSGAAQELEMRGWERASIWLGDAVLLIALLLFTLTSLFVDLARLHIVRSDESRARVGVVSAALFVRQHIGATLAVAATFALLLVVAVAIYALAASRVTPRTWPLILLLIAWQQTFALTRTGLRVGLLAALTRLVDARASAQPQPATADAPIL